MGLHLRQWQYIVQPQLLLNIGSRMIAIYWRHGEFQLLIERNGHIAQINWSYDACVLRQRDAHKTGHILYYTTLQPALQPVRNVISN